MQEPILKAILKLDTTDFNANIEKAKRSGKDLEKKLENLKSVGLGFASVGAAISASLGLIVKSFINVTSQINDNSKALQLNTQIYQELDYVASQTGTSIEALGMGIKTLSRVVLGAAEGNKNYRDALSQLGLSYQELIKLSPEKQLQTVGKALNALPNATQRAALSLELFGKQGGAILQAAVEMENLTKEAKRLGTVISRDVIRAGDQLGDSFSVIQKQTNALIANLGAALAPRLMKVSKTIQNVLASIIAWVSSHQKFISTILITVSAIGGLALAFGAVLTAITIIAPALAVLGVTLGALASPILIVVAAITALVALTIYWKDVWFGLQVAIDFVIKNAIQNLLTFIQTGGKALGWLPGVGDKIKTAALAAANELSDAINNIDKEAAERKQAREQEKLDILKTRLKNEKDAEASAAAERAATQALIDKQMFEEGRKRNEEIMKRDMEFVKRQAEAARKAIDARLQYEKAQFDSYSTEQKRATLESEKEQIAARLATARYGTAEYYEILKQQYENEKALRELSQLEFVSGFQIAYDEIMRSTINFTEVFQGIYSAFTSAIANQLTNLADGQIKTWKDVGGAITAIWGALKQAVINALAEMLAKEIAMYAIEKAVAAGKVILNAVIGGSDAAAKDPNPYTKIATGLAVFAGIAALGAKIAGAFEQGGKVGGNSYTGDKLLIRVNSGERVLNNEHQKWLENMANSQDNDVKQGGDVTISQNITIENGGDIQSIIAALREGTLEAAEMAGLMINTGNKQAGLVV